MKLRPPLPQVEVYDWDLLGADDFVGGCAVPLRLAYDPAPEHAFVVLWPSGHVLAERALREVGVAHHTSCRG